MKKLQLLTLFAIFTLAGTATFAAGPRGMGQGQGA